MKLNTIFFLIIVSILTSSNIYSSPNQYKKDRNILILHSYHQGLEWTDNVTKGIQSVFNEESEVKLYFEYLDTKRNSSPEYFKALSNFYNVKKENNVYDAIIISDNAAYNFMQEHSKTFYPNTPIVFCGVNNLDTNTLKQYPLFFGYDESINYKATIESIISIFPSRDSILIINDNTITGQAIKKDLDMVTPLFKDKIHFEYYSQFDMDDLRNKVSNLSDSYCIYLLVLNNDKHRNFISYKKGIEAIKEVTKVPIFGSWGFYEKKGLFGGKITKGFDQGKYAATLAKKIIETKSTKGFKQANNLPNSFSFDYNEMKKFNISPNQLPDNSIILNTPNRKETLYRIILIASIILLLITIYLAINLIIKKRTTTLLHEMIDEKTKLLKEANNSLKMSITKKDQFLSILAHDLKGPFNGLLGFSSFIIERYDLIDNETKKSYLLDINKEIKRTYKLLQGLLSWSYTQSGEIKFTPKKENVSQLISEITDVLKLSADNKSIKLIVTTPTELFLYVDKNMFSTIIRNLISNALKFTPTNGTVTISAIEENNRALFTVKDSGIGMSEAMRSELFTTNTIFSREGTQNEQGTGFGLRFCKEFVEAHNGKIWVESEIDNGSTFIFSIPKDSNKKL